MKKRTRLSLVALVTVALWLAGLSWFTRTVQESLPPAGESADAIVALTGGSNRIATAFNLLEQKRGKKLFISGVYRGVEVHELLSQWKKETDENIDCCIVLGFKADDTVGNAHETVEWMKKENYKSIILVTANYHLKRATLAFRGIDRDIKIIPWPVAPEGLDMNTWWRNPTYRSLIIREYMKYLATAFLYAVPGNPI